MSRECEGGIKPATWAIMTEGDFRPQLRLPEPKVLVSDGDKVVPIAERTTFQRGPILGETPSGRVEAYTVLGDKATFVR